MPYNHRIVWTLPLILLVLLIPLSHAADDSNSGDFTGPSHSLPPLPPVPVPVNSTSQSLASGIEKLNQDVQNPDVQKLTTALRDQNTTEAKSTLQNLQTQLQDPGSTASQQLPTSLKDTLQSTTCNDSGCSVDWNKFGSLVQPDSINPNGVPQSLSGDNPVSVADQLRTLATMAANADPSLSQKMTIDANLIMQYLDSPSSGYNGPFQNLKPPDLPMPNIGTQSSQTGGGSPSGPTAPVMGGLPGIGTSAGLVIVPVIAILAGFIGYTLLRRKPVMEILRGKLPIVSRIGLGRSSPGSLDPQDPRDSIILSFRRAVMLMLGRGVQKFSFETHREFSTKCDVRPEKPFVGKLSSLYERAVFSGRRVTNTHAEEARRQVALIEECQPPPPSKE